MCVRTNMVACELRINCCVLESCCSFDGGFPSGSTGQSEIVQRIICLCHTCPINTIIFRSSVAIADPSTQKLGSERAKDMLHSFSCMWTRM